MTRQVSAIPVWSDANTPSPELLIQETEHLHFAPSTIERAIGRLKAQQADYLEHLERQFARPTPARQPTPAASKIRQHRQVPATPAEPVLIRSVRPAELGQDDVHPLAWADALRRAEGDVRRLKVVSHSSVVVLNHPCEG